MKTLGRCDGMGMRKRAGWSASLLAIGAVGLWAGAAQAETAPEPADAAGGDIVVTGYRYLSEDTSGTTGLPLSIESVPQSISLVNQDFLKATDIKTLGEVAQYTPGALFDGNPGGFGSVVKLRGFTSGNAIDGLNVGLLDFEPDFATLERLEIVKGPTSVVYGAANPGGIINQVTKSARADTPSYVQVLGGSWGRWRAEGQVAGALNEAGTIRAIGVAAHEEAGSFMKRVDSAKTVAYLGLDADLTDTLSGYLHGGYEHYRRTPFDGIPTLPDGSPAPVGRSFFIGSGDFDIVTRVKRVNGGLNWEPSSAWSVSLKLNYLYYNTTGQSGFGFDLQPNGDFFLAAQRYTKNDQESFSAGLSSLYKLDDLGLADSFVTVAANYQDYRTQSNGLVPDLPNDMANIFDGIPAIEAALNAAQYPGYAYALGRRLRYLTLSGQADIKVAEPLTLLGGISWSKPDVTKRSGTGPRQDFSGDSQTSLRLAATLEPVKGLNIYASYSESFQPQLFIDTAGNVLAPLSGEQYELGVKYVSSDRRLLLSGALFDVRQANQARYDQTVNLIDRYKAIGEVRHRGLELQAVGEIVRGWQVNAGLSLLDPKIRKDDDPTLIGTTVTFLPKTTASLFTSYMFDNGLLLGGGARYVGSVNTAYDGSTRDIASYTLVDASAGYSFDGWRLQLNLKNLFDKKYYINNYQTLFYGNVVGEPRSFTISVRRDF
ncbi:TonB-dependent siderophore receptor [Rhizorhabdus wittichii]|uniref:TonB-dependent siderophore receptor n=1 Tax=Rhizorhabdus wittichii TaxID=160791 RepID=UPI00031C4E06|nr:TonB-dependent siderophore receptor [Rhizorhabdus wittichii]